MALPAGSPARGGGVRGEGAGLPRAAAAAHCEAGGPRAAGHRTGAAAGDGEQGAAAPRVCRQPQEDEAAAGPRAARLCRL